MEDFELLVYLAYGASGGLVFLYFTTVVHIWRGKFYWRLVWLIVMLIVSNIGTFLIYFADQQLFYKNNVTGGNIWLLGISFVVQNAPFNVSHYLLAYFYQQLAEQIPRRLNGTERTDEEARR